MPEQKHLIKVSSLKFSILSGIFIFFIPVLIDWLALYVILAKVQPLYGKGGL